MTMNVRTVNVITVIVNSVMRVLLIVPVTKRCREYLARDIPSGGKNFREKDGGNLATTATNNGECNLLMMFLLFHWHC